MASSSFSPIANKCFTIKHDTPKKGCTFYDMAPLLASPALRREVTARLYEETVDKGATIVLALETRGYFVGSWLADALGTPLERVRKTPNALKTHSAEELVTQSFDLEYKEGESFSLPKGSIPPFARVLIADDVYATGGSANTTIELVKEVCPTAIVVGVVVLLDLGLPLCVKLPFGVTNLFDVQRNGQLVEMPGLEKFYRGVAPTDKRAVLMWHPTMEDLAEKLLQDMPDRLRPSQIQWKNFPDGWPNVRFEHSNTLQDRHVVFLASFHDKNITMEQISMMIALPRQLIKSLRVIIPYFGPGTMERVSFEGELATAETMAKQLSAALPPTKQGPPVINIFDIHALCERFYFNDNATIRFESALSLIKAEIISRKMTVVFPDEGAFKRFYLEFKGVCPMVVCSKVRGQGDERTVSIVQTFTEHSYGPSVDIMKQPGIIIDDLAQSGSTIAECAAALTKTYSFSSISAYVTHAVFPDHSYRRFLKGGDRNVLETFYVTNSNPEAARLLRAVGHPFKVLDLSPIIVNILTGYLPARTVVDEASSQNVVLCTTSKVKLRALTSAFQTLHWHPTVVCVGVPSGIPAQPIGQEQIEKGVQKRSSNAQLKNMPDYTVYVAIESGLVEVEGVLREMSCIKVSNGKRILCSYTSGVTVSGGRFAQFLPEVMASKGSVTLGSLIHDANPGIPADEWYDRESDLAVGLTQLLGKLNAY